MFAVARMFILQGVLAYLFYDTWIAALILQPVGVVYLWEWRKDCCRKKECEFREQFRDSMQIMASVLKVGYSVENAIRETEKELHSLYRKDSRIRREYERMVRRMNMNVTAAQVLQEFAGRVRQEDAKNFAAVFIIAKHFGGDSIAILKDAVRIISSKIETEGEIQTILAAKKMEFQIMCVIPLGMIFYMRMAFSQFLAVLYGNLAGNLLMSICLALYVFAYYMGRRMIQIEV